MRWRLLSSTLLYSSAASDVYKRQSLFRAYLYCEWIMSVPETNEQKIISCNTIRAERKYCFRLPEETELLRISITFSPERYDEVYRPETNPIIIVSAT